MIDKLTIQKVEDFFSRNFVKDTIQISILKNSNGYYELFDKYLIIPEDKKFRLEVKHSHNKSYFYTLQNAVTYCVFENKNKFTESTRIYNLDKMVESLNFSINLLKSMLKKATDVENKLIYSGKLSQDEAKRAMLLNELIGYRRQANYWQNSKFNPTGTKLLY